MPPYFWNMSPSFWNMSPSFWNMLSSFWNIPPSFWDMLPSFLDMLPSFWIMLLSFWNMSPAFENMSPSFWNIAPAFELHLRPFIFLTASLASALRYETLDIPNLFFQHVFPVSTQRPWLSDIWERLRSLSRSALTINV